MDLILMWVGTLVFSGLMKLCNELRIFKDVADNGYKIDLDKLAQFNRKKNNTGIVTLIPIVNMMNEVMNASNYNRIKYTLIDQLKVQGALIELSDLEKKIYAKHPTSISAFLLPIKAGMIIDTTENIEVREKYRKGNIYYRKEKNGFDVVETTGIFDGKDEHELISEIKEFERNKILNNKFLNKEYNELELKIMEKHALYDSLDKPKTLKKQLKK